MKRCDRIVLFINMDALSTLSDYGEDRSTELSSLMSEMLEDERYALILISGSALNQMKRALPVPHAIYASKHGMEINIGMIKLMNPLYMEYQRAIEGICGDMSGFKGATLSMDGGGGVTVDYSDVESDNVIEVKKAFIKAVKDCEGLEFELLQGPRSISAVIARRTHSSMVEIIMAEIGAQNPFVIFLGSLKTDRSAISAVSRTGPNLCAVTDAQSSDKAVPYVTLRSIEELTMFIHMLMEEHSHHGDRYGGD